MLTREKAVSLVNFLYYPNCLALNRKRDKAELVKSWIRPEGMEVNGTRRRWTEEDIDYLKSHSVEDSMKTLNRSKYAVLVKLNRLI